MAEVEYYEVREAIKEILSQKEHDDGSLGPLFVRLAWHASGTYNKHDKTGGSNGSTMRFEKEANDPSNNGLGAARKYLEPIKQKFPEISYADLWTLAGVVSIKALGGPEVPWKSGRKDATEESLVPENGLLPDATQGANHVENVFDRMGFSNREIVALLGAHSLGRCHAKLSGFEGKWTYHPTQFSNMFYKHLLQSKWEPKQIDTQTQYEAKGLMMLPSDMALLDDRFKQYVEEFAKSKDVFFIAFAAAFGRLLGLGFESENKGSSY